MNMERRDAAWPAALMAAVLLAVAALLAMDTQVWRPGWATGDESDVIRRIVSLHNGQAWSWHWLQGSLYQGALSAWARWSQPSLGALHGFGLLVVALEAAAFYALLRRWSGPETAAWSLLAWALSAQAWMRFRTVMAYQAVPLGLLLTAWLLIRARSLWGAACAGLVAGAVAMEYETAALALPFLAWALWVKEPGQRGHLKAALLPALLLPLALLWLDRERLGAYWEVRGSVYAGGGDGSWAGGLGGNLLGLFTGGKLLAYLGCEDWPLLAPWAWTPLALGALVAAQNERAALAWALALTLLPLSTASLWGLPPHRLSGAVLPLAWLSGMGLVRLRERLGAKARPVLLAAVLLGGLLELHGWWAHKARRGHEAWGRAGVMAAAVKEAAASAQAEGLAVSTSLYRVPYPELGYLLPAGLRAQPQSGSAGLVVLAPPQLAWALPAQQRALRRHRNEEPVLLLTARGSLGQRIGRIEASLAPLEPWSDDRRVQSARDRAWLSRGDGDPWAYDLVLERDLLRHWKGLSLGPEHQAWLEHGTRVSPGPQSRLAAYLLKRDPEAALRLYGHVAQRWPSYTPALLGRQEALRALGRADQAAQARRDFERALDAGDWPIYD